MLQTVLCGAACAAAAYLLGSLSFSIIVTRLLYHKDIRTFGSGNAGMTNVLRTFGKGAAAYPAVTFLYFHFVAGRDVVLTTCCAAVIGGLVIWLHRSNIQRIKNGTEYKFGRKKK